MPGMKLRDSIPLWLRAPRNSLFIVLAVLLPIMQLNQGLQL